MEKNQKVQSIVIRLDAQEVWDSVDELAEAIQSIEENLSMISRWDLSGAATDLESIAGSLNFARIAVRRFRKRSLRCGQ